MNSRTSDRWFAHLAFRLVLTVLPLAISVEGQEIEKTTAGGAQPAPLKALVTSHFFVPGEKRAPLPTGRDSLSRAISEVRERFFRSEQVKLKENRRQAEAEGVRIRRAGDVQALWRSQLEEASARMKSGGPTARMEKISAELRAKLSYIAFCQTPTLVGISNFATNESEITVGYSMYIYGCHLGESAGTVHLHAPGSGIDFNVTTMEWHDDYIYATVGVVTGIQNQPSVLSITTPSGATSNSVDVLVRAELDFATAAARPNSNMLTAQCADTTDYDQCVSLFKDPQFQVVDHSIGAIHFSRCCFNGVSGTDRFFVSVKNGWTLATVVLKDYSLATCSAPFGNDPGSVDQPTGYTSGAATTEIDVHWWVDANCSEASYFLDAAMWGPKGVPYE